VSAGRFRADLYYRINVCTLEVPPLREREGDIALLAQSFTQRFAERHHKEVRGLTAEALGKLLAYSWPGNVRELEKRIERAVAMTQTDRLVVDDLPDRLRAYRPESMQSMVPDTVDAIMRWTSSSSSTSRASSAGRRNKSRAARLLGYDRRTLYRKLDRVKGEAAANGTHGANATARATAPTDGTDRTESAAAGDIAPPPPGEPASARAEDDTRRTRARLRRPAAWPLPLPFAPCVPLAAASPFTRSSLR